MPLNRETTKKAVAELAIIVLGVLIALQAEGWVEGRRDNERERVQLEALAADFEQNLERIDGVISRQQRTLHAIGGLFRLADGTDPPPEADSLSTLVARANIFQRFEPILGAYEGLVASGDLGLIESRELRAELASFASEAQNGFEDRAQADLYHVDLNRVAARTIPFWTALPQSFTQRLGYDGGPEGAQMWPLVESREYMGLMTAVGIVESNYMGYFERLRQAIVRIQALIAAEQS